MDAAERKPFRVAALSSIAPPGATSLPTRTELLERAHASAILTAQLASRGPAMRVGAIIDALRSDMSVSRARRDRALTAGDSSSGTPGTCPGGA